jgi:hypothetical protein
MGVSGFILRGRSTRTLPMGNRGGAARGRGIRVGGHPCRRRGPIRTCINVTLNVHAAGRTSTVRGIGINAQWPMGTAENASVGSKKVQTGILACCSNGPWAMQRMRVLAARRCRLGSWCAANRQCRGCECWQQKGADWDPGALHQWPLGNAKDASVGSKTVHTGACTTLACSGMQVPVRRPTKKTHGQDGTAVRQRKCARWRLALCRVEKLTARRRH